MNLYELFKKHNDEYLNFKDVEPKMSLRADLHAYMLLDNLCPSNDDIVSAASHDEIWLWCDCDELVETATEDDIITLIRCGIRYDANHNSLCMFV